MKVLLQHKLSKQRLADLRTALPPWAELAVDEHPQSDEKRPSDAEVLLHVLHPVRSGFFARAPALRLIQKIGVGVNTIDLDAARDAGVYVANMPGTNSQAVAEQTLLLMLGVLRKITALDAAVRTGRGWQLPADEFDLCGEISGRTIGFCGFGEIPRRLTPVLRALGATVIYCLSSKSSELAAACSTDEVFRRSDIISLHVPLTEQTRGLIDASALARMQSHAILINTARGDLVVQHELIQALSTRRIAGAGLDVMAVEPCETGDVLLSLDNVVLTPHVAWLTNETLTRSFSVIAENCKRLRSGDPLLHRVV